MSPCPYRGLRHRQRTVTRCPPTRCRLNCSTGTCICCREATMHCFVERWVMVKVVWSCSHLASLQTGASPAKSPIITTTPTRPCNDQQYLQHTSTEANWISRLHAKLYSAFRSQTSPSSFVSNSTILSLGSQRDNLQLTMHSKTKYNTNDSRLYQHGPYGLFQSQSPPTLSAFVKYTNNEPHTERSNT